MSVKWDKIYTNEQELINDMMLTKTDVNKCYYHELCKGYEYLDSFKRYYLKNGCLTEKQMTQVKRLAGAIYNNVHNVSRY